MRGVLAFIFGAAALALVVAASRANAAAAVKSADTAGASASAEQPRNDWSAQEELRNYLDGLTEPLFQCGRNLDGTARLCYTEPSGIIGFVCGGMFPRDCEANTNGRETPGLLL